MGQKLSQNEIRELNDDDDHLIIYGEVEEGKLMFIKVPKDNNELKKLKSYQQKSKITSEVEKSYKTNFDKFKAFNDEKMPQLFLESN